jgi:hypothetical protein
VTRDARRVTGKRNLGTRQGMVDASQGGPATQLRGSSRASLQGGILVSMSWTNGLVVLADLEEIRVARIGSRFSAAQRGFLIGRR